MKDKDREKERDRDKDRERSRKDRDSHRRDKDRSKRSRFVNTEIYRRIMWNISGETICSKCWIIFLFSLIYLTSLTNVCIIIIL